MASSLDFPPELQDLVVDHLHDQKHTLCICGLVAKSWLRSSRHHLFTSVFLRYHNWEDFVQLLGSPLATFAQSINSLTISVSDYDTHSPGSSSNLNRVILLLRTFHEPEPRFPANPLRFPALRSLRLEDCHWPGVTETTANSLVALFPNITELDLHLVTFLSPSHMVVMVSPFSQLQKASINPLFLQRESAFDLSHYPEVPHNLAHLRLRLGPLTNNLHFDQVVLWFHVNPPIRVLELGMMDAQSLPSVGNLLRALGPQLQDFDLKLMYHVTAGMFDDSDSYPVRRNDRTFSDDIKTHIDLSQNTNLHRLTIHLSLRRFQPAAAALHAPWALLAAPHSTISTLTLVLSIDFLELLDNLDWTHLNTALETYPQFIALRRLHFIVHCPSMMDAIEGQIRARVQEYSARGIVEVSLLHTSRVFTHGEGQL
ncbi:hypothetical protein B0H13DRAFT_2422135 [Mycena leptocephala]|nr:hypothetical protein B0H13DRAFT_2422135 [Mycena leptocephala]